MRPTPRAGKPAQLLCTGISGGAGAPTFDNAVRKFARSAGVRIIDNGHPYNERYHYTEKGYPNTTVGGFRTERAAYAHWLASSFGENTSRAILALIRRTV